jgi:putative sterol carrier protein
MTAELTDRIEASFEKSDEELKEDLPGLLADISGQERELMQKNPELFQQVTDRMGEMEIAGFVSDEPEAASQFQDLLWTGVSLLVEENEDIQNQIAADITANFEANDCPMEGHLVVDADEQTVTGGAGHANDADLTLTGPADVLTSLITGGIDPVQGFMQQQYQLDGSVQKGTQLASVMGEITESVSS